MTLVSSGFGTAQAAPDSHRAALSNPSAAPANAQTVLARADDDSDIDDSASMWAPFNYYMPMGLDEDLHPEVEDEVIIMWVMAAILPLGEFWLPYIFGDPGDGYFADMVTAYFLHGVGYMPVAVAVVPFVGWAIAYIWFIGYTLAAKFWLNPVAMLNLYSRSLYRVDNNELHPLVEGGRSIVDPPAPSDRARAVDMDDEDDDDDVAEDATETDVEVASPPRQPAPAAAPAPAANPPTPTPDPKGTAAPGLRAQYAY